MIILVPIAHSVYRLHWEMFPAYHDVSPRIYQDLKGMIIHGAYGPSYIHCRSPLRYLHLCRYTVFRALDNYI
jgi:hypothetical protein